MPQLRGDEGTPVLGRRQRYYFRTRLLETGAERYAWLNDVVRVGSGCVVDGGVAHQVSHVL